MRMLGFCVGGSIAALLMVDGGAAGKGVALIGSALQPPPSEQVVVRSRKGDRHPIVTVTPDQQVTPATGNSRQPAPAAKPQPTIHKPALLQGCEPALSPLTGAAPTGLHARCVADAGKTTRLAALN